MSRGWCAGVALLLLPTFLAPHAAAQASHSPPVPPAPEGAVVKFYAHWYDVLNRAPLNTRPPDRATEYDLNQGFQMPTLVLRTPCAQVCDVTFQNNLFTMFTLAGETPTSNSPIDYDTRDPSYDVRLGDGPIYAYLYLSAHPVPTQNSSTELGAPTNVGLMPMVKVDAQWETGRTLGKGTVIARGATPDAINMVNLPGQDPVYEVRIPMGRFVDTIPWGDSYGNPSPGTTFTVRIHQVVESESEVSQPNWRLRSGPDYPWRIEVPMENPLIERGLQWSVINRTMDVRWTVKAAWGAYDIDASTFRLRAIDADGATVTLPATRVEYSPLHDAQMRSVHAVWSLQRSDLPGVEPWHLQAVVTNLQGNFLLHETTDATFPSYGGSNSTPGFETALLAFALLLLLRRRA